MGSTWLTYLVGAGKFYSYLNTGKVAKLVVASRPASQMPQFSQSGTEILEAPWGIGGTESMLDVQRNWNLMSREHKNSSNEHIIQKELKPGSHTLIFLQTSLYLAPRVEVFLTLEVAVFLSVNPEKSYRGSFQMILNPIKLRARNTYHNLLRGCAVAGVLGNLPLLEYGNVM